MAATNGSKADAIAALIDQASELAPTIEAAAQRADETGVEDPALLQDLTRRGFMDIVTPEEFGGLDLTPAEALRVYEAIGAADPVVAWLMMVTGNNRKFLEMLDHDVAASLFADGAPRIAGSVAPSGTAERVEGGYRVTGRWGYASGYPTAEYVTGAAVVTENGTPVLDESGARVTIIFVMPKSASRHEGNWNVVGLRGTGSVDHSITDEFVATEFTIVNSYAASKWGGRSALVGFTGWMLFSHTAIEIGLGRAILDEMKAHATHQSYRKGKSSESEVFRYFYAQAEARYRAARAWMWEIWREVDETIYSGQEMTQLQQTDARNALLFFNRANRENAAFVFEELGGTAIRPSRIQRLYRDHLTASQHVQVNRKYYQLITKAYLGEAEGYVWTPHDLVPPKPVSTTDRERVAP